MSREVSALSSNRFIHVRPAVANAASVLLLLVIVGVVGRLIAYKAGAWNFTPVAAIALFAGFYFRNRLVGALAPLAVMLISNIVISSYESTSMMLSVYAALLLPVALATVLRRELSAVRVGLCALSSSLVFFLFTNFCHWLFMRPNTAPELLSCYVEALPFFRGTFAGDLIWSTIIFGSYALATWNDFVPRRAEYARIRK